MGLGENDNLMIDWGESLVNDFCNQEVEKRIKERVPITVFQEPTNDTHKCDVCGCHPTVLIRTNLGLFCQQHVKYSYDGKM